MSNAVSNSPAEKPSSDSEERHLRTLRRLSILTAGVWIYLLLLVLISFRVIMVTWPGSFWISAWYGNPAERRAAMIVMEKTTQTLREAAVKLARLDHATENPLTAADIEKLNQDLETARELVASCQTAGPCDTHPAKPDNRSQTKVDDKPPAKAGDVQKEKTDKPGNDSLKKMSNEQLLAVELVSGTAPTSLVLENLRALVTQAQSILLNRGKQLEPALSPPSMLDLLFARSPRPLPGAKVWHPLASETTAYADALTSLKESMPAAWFGSVETHYLLAVFLFGILGASVRGLASIPVYVGNQSLRDRWLLYYLTQPWLGAGLATVFYVLFRGGLLKTNSDAVQAVNLYGFAAIAVIVGLSSKQALDKIHGLASELFGDKPNKDPKDSPRSDDLKVTLLEIDLRADGMGGVISGKNLLQIHSLMIDSEEMTKTSATDTSLAFQVPPGAASLNAISIRELTIKTDAGAVRVPAVQIRIL